MSLENVILAIGVVACLGLTFQSIKAMTRNWELAERLNTERKTLELLEIEVELMGLENDYYRSDEYQELMSRKLANKQEPGENMVYLPENSEVAKNKHATVATSGGDGRPTYSNFELWMRYLFP